MAASNGDENISKMIWAQILFGDQPKQNIVWVFISLENVSDIKVIENNLWQIFNWIINFIERN